MSGEEIKGLVLRAQAGDGRAFGALVERFQGTVNAVALGRLRNATEAQELTQEVFVHILAKLPQLREVECFAGWARQITVRMAINRLTRRAPARGAEPEVLESVPATGAGPLEELVRAEQRRELLDGLRRLNPIDRETLEAFYIRSRSLKQMSREFEVPVGTIKRRLHVARKRLRDQLEGVPAGKARGRVGRPRKELVCV